MFIALSQCHLCSHDAVLYLSELNFTHTHYIYIYICVCIDVLVFI